MPLALPFDIWCLIAKFIPQPELLKLYSVNSAFFHLVMSEQYRHVAIYHIGDESTRRCLANMSPVVATCVRSLELHPQLFGKAMNIKRKSFIGKLLDYIRPPSKLTETISQALLRHITSMTEVTSLTISCYPCDDLLLPNLTTSFGTTVWSAQGSRLRSLSLSIPLEAYSNILVAAPTLESLDDLGITLRTANLSTICEEILPLVVFFIERHSQSLHSLSVETDQATLNPFHFFHNLGQLPHLTKLSINLPLDHLRPEYPTAIDSFLTKHTNLLRNFSIRVCDTITDNVLPSPDEFFSYPIFQVRLPHLTSLELGLFQWRIPRMITDSFVKYLLPMRKTLSRVAISDYALTLPELERIVSVFSNPESQLRSLEIYVYRLDCQLFDLLSQRLPELYHLGLGSEDGSLMTDYSWAKYNRFATQSFQDMANRVYPDWTLRHVTLSPYYCSGKWEECRGLVDALPSVLTFNGLSGDNLCKLPDYKRSL